MMSIFEDPTMSEKRDIALKVLVSPTEWAAIRNRRDSLGLSESAYLRLLALQDVSHASRQQLFRESGFPASTESGQN
jgi:hypothetical protein